MNRRNFLKGVLATAVGAAVSTCSSSSANPRKVRLVGYYGDEILTPGKVLIDKGSESFCAMHTLVQDDGRVYISKLDYNDKPPTDRCYWTEVNEKYAEQMQASVYFSEWCYANTKS